MTRGIGSVQHHMGFHVPGTSHGDKRGRTTIHILDNREPTFHDTHELDTDEFEEAVRAQGSVHAAAYHHAAHLMRDHSSPPQHTKAPSRRKGTAHAAAERMPDDANQADTPAGSVEHPKAPSGSARHPSGMTIEHPPRHPGHRRPE